jgi:AraC-like DNA-binding protein
MKFTIPSFLEHQNILKKIDELSYAKYVSYAYQHKNEVEILNNALIFVVQGSKILHLSSGEHRIEAGEVLFLKSGNYVMSEVVDERYEAFLFFYSDTLLVDFIQKYDLSLHDTKETYEVCVLHKTEHIKNVVHSFIPYFENEIDDPNLLKLKFEELFLHLLSADNDTCLRGFLRSIYEADLVFKSEIEKRYTEFSTVTQMATYFKMSENSFRKKFQNIFATTPKQWLNQKRLQRAKILLETTDKNVSEVAREVMFNDLSWFTQSFKKHFGISPKECKNNKK